MVHTECGDDIADLVARVVEDFFERSRRGEHPQLEEFIEQYPGISDLLRTVIPGLQATEQSPDASADGKVSQEQHKQLGDFRILRQIGRGGMGIVYEAEQISMNRRVALKVLPLAGLVDELKIRRFQNEVRAVAALDHPNIVPVYMVGEERGVHYFAMQLIRGRSLSEVISSLRDVRDEAQSSTVRPSVKSRAGAAWTIEPKRTSMWHRSSSELIPLVRQVRKPLEPSPEPIVPRFLIRHVASTFAAWLHWGFRQQLHCNTRTM